MNVDEYDKKEENMLQIESKSLLEYYGKKPQNYTIGFLHYQVDLCEETVKEYQLLEEDFWHIKEYVGEEKFKIYFSEIETLNKVFQNTNILENFSNFIYIRIRNNDELLQLNMLVPNKNIKIIIDNKNLKNISEVKNNNYETVLQIDTISELTINELNKLKTKFNITQILVGQICYLSKVLLPFLQRMAKKFQISSDDYLEIEKNVLISNDFYSLSTYKKILHAFYELVDDIPKNDNEVNKFFTIYNRITQKISYDFDHLDNDLLEDQNLIGGLFNKTCVCEGYTKILQQALSLLHIESVVVGGGGPKSEDGHLWNQVKIGGTWYNADVTLDSIRIHNGEEIGSCLVSDDMVYETDYPIAKRCDISYDCKTFQTEVFDDKKIK